VNCSGIQLRKRERQRPTPDILRIATTATTTTFFYRFVTLRQLWTMVWRALDDIKETVRKAAKAAWKSLASTSTRFCDPRHTPAEGVHKVRSLYQNNLYYVVLGRICNLWIMLI
jgi:hypothetical protein